MSTRRIYKRKTNYFITIVTHNRIPIFKDQTACDLLLNTITYQKMNYLYNIKSFVIMPEHIHLIIKPTKENNISEIIKAIRLVQKNNWSIV